MRRLAAIVLLVFVAAAPVAAASPTIRVTISASHTVKANAKWPVVVRVTDASGKPLAGTLTNNILLGGIAVGKVDNGKVWRFRGSWQEPKGQEITWPAAGRGQTFGFQTVVRVGVRKVKKTFLVTVR
jgi:hypothetical protein